MTYQTPTNQRTETHTYSDDNGIEHSYEIALMDLEVTMPWTNETRTMTFRQVRDDGYFSSVETVWYKTRTGTKLYRDSLAAWAKQVPTGETKTNSYTGREVPVKAPDLSQMKIDYMTNGRHRGMTAIAFEIDESLAAQYPGNR